MIRCARLQSKADDLAYPIRVKFRVPNDGLGGVLSRLSSWLNENVGRRRDASHSTSVIAGQGMAPYFRSLEDAQRCVAAFPSLRSRMGWEARFTTHRE